MTLREQVIAMADDMLLAPPMDRSDNMIRALAIEAARLALEDAREKCDYNRYVNAKSQGPWTEGIRDGMTQASLAIRSLRDGLE